MYISLLLVVRPSKQLFRLLADEERLVPIKAIA